MPSSRSGRGLRTLLSLLILAAALGLAYWILTRSPEPAAPTYTFAHTDGPGIDVATWNIANLGGSKDEVEIGVMADVLRTFDLVAIQEVITSPPGAQAVARLVDALERRGSDWDYRISDPTEGAGPERYAYLWKPSRVRLEGRAWLETSLDPYLDREPYLARFTDRETGRQFLTVSFHAVPKSKDPAREIPVLLRIHEQYPDEDVLMMGDFNLDAVDEAFGGLRGAGYRAVLVDQRTTLRMERRDDGPFANPYDNILYEADEFTIEAAGIVDFTAPFASLRDARAVSDHVPVFVELQVVD